MYFKFDNGWTAYKYIIRRFEDNAFTFSECIPTYLVSLPINLYTYCILYAIICTHIESQ